MSPPLLAPSASAAGTVAPLTLLGRASFLCRAVVKVMRSLRLWSDRMSQREALAELDDRLLRDIGLSRRDVRRELEKPPWRG